MSGYRSLVCAHGAGLVLLLLSLGGFPGCAQSPDLVPSELPRARLFELLPPPTKAIGIMKNFPPLDPDVPVAKPGFFVRAASSLARAGDPIVLPHAYDTVLYEAELVIIIGRRARNVSVDEAEEFIYGYTCGMDGSPSVTDADGQLQLAPSLAGKSADGIAPVGGRIVRSLGASGHDIILRVNGRELERTNTDHMVMGPAELVSMVSQSITLEVGDVIFTGASKAIPKMRAGDVVEVEITGVGILECPVVASNLTRE